MIDHSPKTPHYRLLSLMDELHRIGLEQLRFSRSYSTMHACIYVYAARSAQSQDRESGSSPGQPQSRATFGSIPGIHGSRHEEPRFHRQTFLA